MTKIVYNTCYGGFGLSDAAMLRYAELKGITVYPENIGYGTNIYWTAPPEIRTKAGPSLSEYDIERTDPVLVQVVEELGDDANGDYAKLAIIEIEPGTRYRIDEYDGTENVMTIDSYEWRIA